MFHSNKVLRMLYLVPMAVMAAAFWPVSTALAEEPIEQFYVLEERIIDAHEAWVEKLEKQGLLTEEGEVKPGAKLPPDPRPAILKEIDALAEKTLGKEDGAAIAVGAFAWSWNFDVDLDGLLGRFQRLATHYPDSVEVEDVLPVVGSAAAGIGPFDGWMETIRNLITRTKREDTREAAQYYLAHAYLEAERLSEAKAEFAKVRKLAPDSEFAALAKGFMFEIDHLQLGMTAPEFTTKTVDGKPVSLKDLRGKVVLLDFWATWCPQCVAEVPGLRKTVEKFKDQGFQILAVSLDETRSDVERTLESLEFPAIHTWDPAGSDNPVATLYNVQGLPTWFLIDQKGVIRAKDPFGEALEKNLKAIFAEKQASGSSATEAAPRP